MTALERTWERRLAADGLASLDYQEQVKNRGSGKLAGSGAVTPADVVAQAARREESAEVMTWRADVLRAHRFIESRDRRIWALHAEGVGTREIAKQLHHRRRIVVASINATTAAAKKRSQRRVDPSKAIRTAAPEFLFALLRTFAGGHGG